MDCLYCEIVVLGVPPLPFCMHVCDVSSGSRFQLLILNLFAKQELFVKIFTVTLTYMQYLPAISSGSLLLLPIVKMFTSNFCVEGGML